MPEEGNRLLLVELLVIDASVTPCREEKTTRRGSQAFMHTFIGTHVTRAHLHKNPNVSTAHAVSHKRLPPISDFALSHDVFRK